MSGWIRPCDREPGQWEPVLVITGEGLVRVAVMARSMSGNHTNWFYHPNMGDRIPEVTHWQRIEAPE